MKKWQNGKGEEVSETGSQTLGQKTEDEGTASLCAKPACATMYGVISLGQQQGSQSVKLPCFRESPHLLWVLFSCQESESSTGVQAGPQSRKAQGNPVQAATILGTS